MKAWIINDAHKPERLRETAVTLSKLGVFDLQRAPAVFVKGETDLTTISDPECGCKRAHRNLWKQYVNSVANHPNPDPLIIFEDDIAPFKEKDIQYIKREVLKVLDAVKKGDAEIGFFGWNYTPNNLCYRCGGFAYCLSPQGAQKLLKAISNECGYWAFDVGVSFEILFKKLKAVTVDDKKKMYHTGLRGLILAKEDGSSLSGDRAKHGVRFLIPVLLIVWVLVLLWYILKK